MFFLNRATAQVEIYRNSGADTATYIAPDDTITRAPSFGSDPNDFYRYIEMHYNLRNNAGGNLSYYADNIRFSFYVERNGKISNFEILFATHQMVASQIEKIVINMPEWAPGKVDGRKKRTLMVYDINIQMVDDLPNVLVTKNGLVSQFSDKQKSLKWFLVGGTVITMLTLWLVRR